MTFNKKFKKAKTIDTDSLENPVEKENTAVEQPRLEETEKKPPVKTTLKTLLSIEEDDDYVVTTTQMISNKQVLSNDFIEPKTKQSQPSLLGNSERNYGKGYLEELRKVNAEASQKALERIRELDFEEENGGEIDEESKTHPKGSDKKKVSFAEVHTSSEMEIETEGKNGVIDYTKIQTETEITTKKHPLEEDDDEIDPALQRRINEAREIREKRIKLSSDSDYIPLKINDTTVDLRSKGEKDGSSSESSDEDDEKEMQAWENDILKSTLNPRIREKLEKAEKQRIQQGNLPAIEDIKTFDIGRVLKKIDASIAQHKHKTENNEAKITQLEAMVENSNKTIEKEEKDQKEAKSTFKDVTVLNEFLVDLVDCLDEKITETQEAKHTLLTLHKSYSTNRKLQDQLELNDLLMQINEAPLKIVDDPENLQNKPDAQKKRAKHLQKLIEDICDKGMDFLDIEHEDLTNLKHDRMALYLAAVDIFQDVSEDFQSLQKILSSIYSMKLAIQSVTDENLLEWACQALEPFVSVNLIGYDPLKTTPVEFKNHGIYDLNQIEFVNVLNRWTNELKLMTNALEAKRDHKFEERLAYEVKVRLLENTGREILNSQIEDLWDPLSKKSTESLISAVLSYIDITYTQNPYKSEKEKNLLLLEKIKEILTVITDKLKDFLKFVPIPHNANSKAAKFLLKRALMLIESSFLLERILPASNLGKFIFETLIRDQIAPIINEYAEEERTQLYQKILAVIPEKVRQSEKFSKFLKDFLAFARLPPS